MFIWIKGYDMNEHGTLSLLEDHYRIDVSKDDQDTMYVVSCINHHVVDEHEAGFIEIGRTKESLAAAYAIVAARQKT